MIVTVRLFAQLRERAGSPLIELTLPDDACVSDALDALGPLAAGLPLVLAVNKEYAEPAQPLAESDELAAIPPVSGGAVVIHARICTEALSLDRVVEQVSSPAAGAMVTFSGVTRSTPELIYDGYPEMAQTQLEAILATAVSEHGLCAAAAEHRLGTVALGEASVLIAVSAPHRPEAYAGSRAIIDAIKSTLPIWKQEDAEWKHEMLPKVPSGT